MKNIELLPNISRAHYKQWTMNKGTLQIHLSMINKGKGNFFEGNDTDSKSLFTGCEIGQLMGVILSAEEKYKGIKFPIVITLPNIDFIDKLTYVFLECICYYFIERKGHQVFLQMSCSEKIQTKGVFSSPLLLLTTGKKEKNIKYLEKFKFDIFGYHFRRIIDGVNREATNYLGEFGQQVDSFLKPFGIDEKCRDMFATVCSELVGNACEHAKSDCLVDIDVAPGYTKVLEDGSIDKKYYYGINIAVINFSETMIGDGISNILNSEENLDEIERYRYVKKAFMNHKSLFDEYYCETDFFNITAFQDHISGRKEVIKTGGTGLPKLIKSLQEMSDTYRCYMISGNRCINFEKEQLEYQNGWIGFNSTNDYLNSSPDFGICTECLVYMPGTAYNLNFVMEGAQIKDEEN